MMTARFERRQIDRFLVYVDVALVLVFLASIGLLVVDAYQAGFYEAAANGTAQSTMFWYMVRDIALLMLSMGYFLTRHFRLSMQKLANPWG